MVFYDEKYGNRIAKSIDIMIINIHPNNFKIQLIALDVTTSCTSTKIK